MDKEILFKKYMEGILNWNDKINLTAITEPEDFYIKHILDSLAIKDIPEYVNSHSVLDIGTGAGFPGVILAINNPEKEFTLLDSLNKRLKVIDTLTNELEIKNVKTVHSRAEDFKGKFDLTLSRAVSSMSVLLEYALPLTKLNGYFIAYKGNEEEDFSKALSVLGGKYIRTESSKMEKYGINHNLIIIKKVKETPKNYPRKAGTPLKNPIK